jgi:septum formation protein
MRRPHLILGSLSPRRREILGYFSVPFLQIASDFDEESVLIGSDPISYAETLSKGKAHRLSSVHPDAIILTADTIVYKEGEIFNKPRHEKEAFEYLKSLNGKWHSVFTAVTAKRGAQEWTHTEETKLLFHKVSEKQLQLYHQAFHCTSKAGGYGLQMAGSIIVKRLEGCFYNVMGLPLTATSRVLSYVGLDLWEFLI